MDVAAVAILSIGRTTSGDPILDNLVNKCYFGSARTAVTAAPDNGTAITLCLTAALRLTPKCREVVLFSDDCSFPNIM